MQGEEGEAELAPGSPMGEQELIRGVNALRRKLAASAKRVIDLFKTWDLNGDGLIQLDEFVAAMPQLGFPNCTVEQASGLFNLIDTDGSGDISFRELSRVLKNTPKPKAKVRESPTPRKEEEPADIQALRVAMRAEIHGSRAFAPRSSNRANRRAE